MTKIYILARILEMASFIFFMSQFLKILKKLEDKEKEKEQIFDFERLKNFKNEEYIPLEEVLTKFNWIDLRLAKKETPEIELYYLVRRYGSTDFRIMSASEFKKIEYESDDLFVSPLFKKVKN